MAAKNPFEAVKATPPDFVYDSGDKQLALRAFEAGVEAGGKAMLAACCEALDDGSVFFAIILDDLKKQAATAGFTPHGHDSERGGKESVPERWPSAQAEKGGEA